MVAMVRSSPGWVIGMRCSVDSPFFARLEVKASSAPSGLHVGWPSRSPAVSGRGGLDPSAAATQICERYVLAARSVRETTNAIVVPSGDTAGDVAWTTDPMMVSAMVRRDMGRDATGSRPGAAPPERVVAASVSLRHQ